MLHSMWDPSSPIRDGTLITGPPGKSPKALFLVFFLFIFYFFIFWGFIFQTERHWGDKPITSDISEELGTTLQCLGFKASQETLFGEKSWSLKSVWAGPWGSEGSKKAGPKALALQNYPQGLVQRPLCSLLWLLHGPPSPSSGTLGCFTSLGWSPVPPTLSQHSSCLGVPTRMGGSGIGGRTSEYGAGREDCVRENQILQGLCASCSPIQTPFTSFEAETQRLISCLFLYDLKKNFANSY